MKCNSCGAEVASGRLFCTECGTKLEVAAEPAVKQTATATAKPKAKTPATKTAQPAAQPTAQPVAQPVAQYAPQPVPQYAPQPVYNQPSGEPTGKYAPITTGGFVGISFLLLIPVVNIILLIIWACGGCKKITKRNYARAALIMLLIGLILSLIIGLSLRFIVYPKLGIDANSAYGGLSGLIGSQSSNIGENNDEGGSLSGLEGLLGGLAGGEESLGDGGLGGLEGLLGGGNGGGGSSPEGWQGLREYPGGEVVSVEDMGGGATRICINDTNYDNYTAYLDALRGDGFAYCDIYDLGVSEADWYSMYSAWQASDGNLYIGTSFYDDDTVSSMGYDYNIIIDICTERPDLSAYLADYLG